MKNPQKHVVVLQHHACEGLGTIARALQRARLAPCYIRSYAGQPVPKETGNAVGLIIMGGPQSAYEGDKFPYLRDEMLLVEHALRKRLPVLGVCLGSQLLAATLGAKVYPGRNREIGWNRVTLTKSAASDSLFAGTPRSFNAFHWHGDVFDLPRGATRLASSSLTTTQAFRYGNSAYGLLFHMEVTPAQVHAMVETFADELCAAGLNGTAIRLNSHAHLPNLQLVGATVFRGWIGLLA